MEGLGSFVLKGQRKDSWFPSSFQDAASRWDFQPLRGWLISLVASRQKDGFYRAWRGLSAGAIYEGV
jgi:hypothetical protein